VRLDKIFLFFVVFLFSLSVANAFIFNGTVYTTDGVALNGTLVNMTIRDNTFTVIGSNSTYSNENGSFSMNVSENSQWFYQPVVTYRNGSVHMAYVGQTVPAFPLALMQNINNVPFYLRRAATINITAFNENNRQIAFRYQVKDMKLGYPVSENWNSIVGNVTVYVPADRNYSIIIYPDGSMPASYELNNITSYTNNTVPKAFNTTLGLVRVVGYINTTNLTNKVSGWEEFKIVVYLLEPGNILYTSQSAVLSNLSIYQPFNITNNGPQSDMFNLTSGFFNITLPASAERATFLLFAAAKNNSQYYGGYRNITTLYGDGQKEVNISMYGLLGAHGNISVKNAANYSSNINGTQTGTVNITTALQTFYLANASNVTLTQTQLHIETVVNYTSYGSFEFTFVDDISQSGTAFFSLPLLNVTGIKKMNIYTQSYAPKRAEFTVPQIVTNSTIALRTFSPGDIDGAVTNANIDMALYISNSTCDVPNPVVACQVGSSQNMNQFNPLGSIIGGGPLSFRMGTGSIKVHYVNVDMMASGPPEALFDDSASDKSTSSTFDQAVRFGSGGPTIYDFVLVSIPYTEGAGSGLNDSQTVNMSIPAFYDDNWKVTWNATANGSSGSALAGNYSHYARYKGDWEMLMNSTACQTNATLLNATHPCYIDNSNNNIWIRLPHFSGTQPNVKGTTLPAATTSSSTTGGSSSSNIVIGKKTTTEEEEIDVDYNLGGSAESAVTVSKKQGQSVSFSLDGKTAHTVKFKEIKSGAVTLVIESDPIEVTLAVGETKQVDVDGNGFEDLEVTLQSIVSETARIVMKKLVEDKPAEQPVIETQETAPTGEAVKTAETVPEESKSNMLLWVLIIVAIVVIVVAIVLKKKSGKFTAWHK